MRMIDADKLYAQVMHAPMYNNADRDILLDIIDRFPSIDDIDIEVHRLFEELVNQEDNND